ncbi:MAG: DotA/TraY family protein [Undibacterium umbellatum]|uniref:DotA/TraY family protein n=1 Tax=Undibacterium umbellatum TaxID=2762300 RepID=UPI003BB67AC1
MRTSKKLNIYILLTLAITLMATGAHAGNFWKPTEETNDFSIRIIAFIFGNVVNSIYGGSISTQTDHILSKLLGTMNAGVLVIGMIIMAYTYISGAVHTAKDGEWLGKKWDSMMVPLRTAGGMAMLLPTVAGYSFLQIVLIWCGLQAVGLGDKIWTTASDHVSKEHFLSPPYLAPNKTAKQAFLMVACKQAGDQFDMQIKPLLENEQISYRAAGSQSAQSSGFCGTIRWGSTGIGTMIGNSYKDLVGCDSVISPKGTACQNIVADVSGNATNLFNMTSIDSVKLFDKTDQIEPFEAAMQVAHKKIITDILNSEGNYKDDSRNLNKMVAKLLLSTDEAKKSLLPETPGSFADTISRVQYQYEQDLMQQIRVHTKAILFKNQSAAQLWNSTMADQMRFGGWIHAGSFYMKVGNLNNSVQNVINGAVHTTYTLPNIAGMQNEMQNSAFAAYLNNIEQAVIGTNSLATKIDSQTPRSGLLADARKLWTSVTDGMATGLLKFAKVGTLGEYGLDPLVELKSIGDTTIVAAEAMLVGGASALSASSKDEKGNKSSDSGEGTMALILAAAVGALLSMGMFLGIILPMMPYVFWVTGVAWWLISFVEAVIAAPIWAIAHMHPEGHDVAGRGSPGYMFVLSILVRPALMVIFLFTAMLLIKPIMAFINQGFFQAISNMTEGSLVGVMTVLGTLVLYSGISTKMILMVFGIINTGPDNIMRWIGGSNAVGTQANSTAGSIQQGVDAAGGQAAGGTGKVLGGIGNRIANKRGSVVSSAQS